MADVFCKMDCLALRHCDCKDRKPVADKKERITVYTVLLAAYRVVFFFF